MDAPSQPESSQTTQTTQSPPNPKDPDDLLSLSSEQQLIVDKIDFSKSGIHSVTACAGAGKTRTLSHLVVCALRHVMEREGGARWASSRILLLTATRASKDEAISRVDALQKCMESNEIDSGCQLRPENVRTVHSLALKMLKDANPNTTVQIISNTELKDLLEDIVKQVNLTECKSKASSDLFASLDRQEQASVLAEMRAERLKKNIEPIIDGDPLGALAEFCLKNLEKLLDGAEEDKKAADGGDGEDGGEIADAATSSGIIRGDFASLIYGLANMDGAVCKKGDILFVDESQDLNRCQLEIVLKAAEYGACVVCLGDDSQGIFHFSGAVDRTMHTMAREGQGRGIDVYVYKLLTNFRSTQQIVEASEALLPEEDRQFRKGTKATHNGPPVQLSAWQSDVDESTAVASKIVALISGGECQAGDIVVLRHSNWSFSDASITQLAKKSREAGIEIPHVILGKSGTTGSLTSKLLSSVQVLCGVERFGYTYDEEDEAFDMLQVFLRSIKGSSACTETAKKALAEVFQVERLSNFCELLTLVDTESGKQKLECAFSNVLKEEDSKAEAKARAAKAKGMAAKKQKLDAAAIAKGNKTKLDRFLKTMEAASYYSKRVQGCFEDIFLDNLPLKPIRTQDGSSASRQQRIDAVGQWTPKFSHITAGLVWILARDVLDIKWNPNLQTEFENLITKLDVPVGEDGDAAGALVAPTCRILGEINSKETAGKVVFSTIHRFKGKERPTAFVLGLQEPYSKISDAQSATLFQTHESGCLNLHGNIRGCNCPRFIRGLAKMHESQKNEKKKLGYVAASRAKKQLFLSTVYGGKQEMLAELMMLRCDKAMKETWANVICRKPVQYK